MISAYVPVQCPELQPADLKGCTQRVPPAGHVMQLPQSSTVAEPPLQHAACHHGCCGTDMPSHTPASTLTNKACGDRNAHEAGRTPCSRLPGKATYRLARGCTRHPHPVPTLSRKMVGPMASSPPRYRMLLSTWTKFICFFMSWVECQRQPASVCGHSVLQCGGSRAGWMAVLDAALQSQVPCSFTSAAAAPRQWPR